MGTKARPSRRALLQAGGTGAAALLGAPIVRRDADFRYPRIYTRIGVKPFINLTATYTINGGALMLPKFARQWTKPRTGRSISMS